jgi:phosphoribosylformimino-5-aminoimidazole carboxamide ribotide isomerase
MMKLIPVIDLLDGVVVHARGGQRAAYQPIHTPLCDGSDATVIVSALAALYRFDCLYVADLDAIEGRGDNSTVVSNLLSTCPQLHFWIDAGPLSLQQQKLAPDRIRPVLGSECMDWKLLQQTAGSDWILSLDFDGDGLLGDSALLDNPTTWPEEVILMELQRVGIGLGPNWQRIEQYCGDLPQKQFYAAGGVRSDSDLRQLEKLGITGVLLASALHTGMIESYRNLA